MPGSSYDWDIDPDQNTNSDPDTPWPEGMPSEQVNNSARSIMGRVAELRTDLTGSLVAGGTANALTVTLGSAGIDTYFDGLRVSLTISETNTGAATLNANSIGNKPIRKFSGAVDVALSGGELVVNNKMDFIYSTLVNGGGGGWIPVGGVAGSTGSGAPFAILRKTYTAATATVFASYATWITMPLDTEEYDPDSKVSISANRFTPTIDGWAEWTSIAYLQSGAPSAIPMHYVSRLYNVTDAAEVSRGDPYSASLAGDGSAAVTLAAPSRGIGRVLAGKAYEIGGFGYRANTNGLIAHHNPSWSAQTAGDDVVLRIVLR